MSEQQRPDEGSPGMLGAPGAGAPLTPERQAGDTAIGMPTEPEGSQAPGGSVEPGALTASRRARSPESLGGVGGVSAGNTSGNAEPGTHDVPGTPIPGPLASDPTPPKMPDAPRSGEEGARAIASGAGSGVATGGLPVGDAGRYGAPGFAGGRATPTPGVTGADMPSPQLPEPQGRGEPAREMRDAGRDAGAEPPPAGTTRKD